MVRVLLFGIFCLITLTIPVSFKRLTCGFKIIKLKLDWPYQSDWEVVNNFDAKSILSQRFTYLNRGVQSYVFESLDGKYVIKFFRFDRLKKNPETKIPELFSACRLAFDKARDETGLLYVHLNETSNQLPRMQLTGPLGQKIDLEPDLYRFVIQKKAISFKDAIVKADPEMVRKRIDSFITILRSRLNKGICNSDPALIRNFGFINEKAVEIDFGNYSEKPTSKDLEFALWIGKLQAWLKENAAEWVDYIDDRIASY